MNNVEKARKLLRDNMIRLRAVLKWNQDDLAEASGLSIGYIKKIEAGNQWPQPTSLHAIAEGLGVGVDELFIDIDKVAEKDTLTRAIYNALETEGYEIKKKI